MPEPVSPADTIRRAGEYIETAVHGGPGDFEHLVQVFDAAVALLAVGERDKATIHELEVKLTGYDEFKAAGTECDPGKDGIWEFYDRKLWASILSWKRRALAAESTGEWDRRQIARLTDFVRAYDNLDDALDNLLDYLKLIGWSEQEDRNVKAALKWAERVSGYYGRCNAARAVLADEEDVPPHFFGEQGIRPEPNHTWPLAGEEDAGDE